jgi:hypothetical protein
MTDAQMPIDQIEQEITRIKSLIAECEKRMAVHPTQLDDRKKGEYCPNRRARMQHQRRRDELIALLGDVQLSREVNAAPVQDLAQGAAAVSPDAPRPSTGEGESG